MPLWNIPYLMILVCEVKGRDSQSGQSAPFTISWVQISKKELGNLPPNDPMYSYIPFINWQSYCGAGRFHPEEAFLKQFLCYDKIWQNTFGLQQFCCSLKNNMKSLKELTKDKAKHEETNNVNGMVHPVVILTLMVKSLFMSIGRKGEGSHIFCFCCLTVVEVSQSLICLPFEDNNNSSLWFKWKQPQQNGTLVLIPIDAVLFWRTVCRLWRRKQWIDFPNHKIICLTCTRSGGIKRNEAKGRFILTWSNESAARSQPYSSTVLYTLCVCMVGGCLWFQGNSKEEQTILRFTLIAQIRLN